MIHLQFRYKYVLGFLSEEEIHLMQDEVDIAYSQLVEKAGKGNLLVTIQRLSEEELRQVWVPAGLLYDAFNSTR